MAFLNYEYKMKISYSEPVNKCYFTIKSIPADDFRQNSISYEIDILPQVTYSESKDSFGNHQIIGCVNEAHSEFVYSIKGLVETHPTAITGGVNLSRVGMYKYLHGKCIPGEEIKAFADSLADELVEIKTNQEKAKYIMQKLFECMTYKKGSTEMETTAEEAFAKRCGVCQDYSHIFITLLRLYSIPARYVCGVIVGQGQSHSWVEVACDQSFYALDPTHNQEVTDGYIKFGVGRDACDCAINRGVMWGGGVQTQEITVSVEKYY